MRWIAFKTIDDIHSKTRVCHTIRQLHWFSELRIAVRDAVRARSWPSRKVSGHAQREHEALLRITSDVSRQAAWLSSQFRLLMFTFTDTFLDCIWHRILRINHVNLPFAYAPRPSQPSGCNKSRRLTMVGQIRQIVSMLVVVVRLVIMCVKAKRRSRLHEKQDDAPRRRPMRLRLLWLNERYVKMRDDQIDTLFFNGSLILPTAKCETHSKLPTNPMPIACN